jgi:transposase-like protein
MGFLSRLFGGKKEEPPDEAAVSAAECPHTALVPRWDSAEDMGKEDKISRYRCEGCGNTFSREEGLNLLEAEEERVRALESERTA